ncbi:MAG: bifunctional nuclease family protein [Acidobacteria bacterium]|nr:bifunctional nuclease family protein [Acidobacteriota bacterium]
MAADEVKARSTGKETEDRKIPAEVHGLMMEPNSNQPIVILRLHERDPDESSVVPIWIGIFEAGAIQLAIEGRDPGRPMTHDLLKNALDLVGAEVIEVVVRAIEGNTFLAVVELVERTGEHRLLDARPSDAIALALRAGAPLFVRQSVADLARVKQSDQDEGDGAGQAPTAGTDEKKMRKWLEELDPKTLGKYEM